MGVRCCVSDRSGILFCPDKAKKIQRIARPEGKRPKISSCKTMINDLLVRSLYKYVLKPWNFLLWSLEKPYFYMNEVLMVGSLAKTERLNKK